MEVSIIVIKSAKIQGKQYLSRSCMVFCKVVLYVVSMNMNFISFEFSYSNDLYTSYV